ncbi:MAG: hypothetical protein EOO41_03770, partial [Methanobacteriota archaeon]
MSTCVRSLDCADAFSWWMVGCYYLASGNAADALKQFQKATQLDALCAAAWMGVGQAYCLLHEYEPSLAAYRSAMMLLPESHLPPLCMAAVASQSNQNELARTYLDLATSRCISDPMVHHEAGVLEYRRRAYKQAWASLDFAITLIIDAPLAAKRHWEATMFNMACTCRKLGYVLQLHRCNVTRALRAQLLVHCGCAQTRAGACCAFPPKPPAECTATLSSGTKNAWRSLLTTRPHSPRLRSPTCWQARTTMLWRRIMRYAA